MKIEFDIPMICPANIHPFLEKVCAGEYDVEIYLPPKTRIIDLGANYGSFALWAAHRWPGSEIMAYEPHPKVFKILSANVHAYKQIQVNNWGIGNPGMRVLNDGPNNDGERSFHAAMNNPYPTGIHCEVRDPLTLPECDVIKLDIEGCEYEVLEPLIKAGRRPSLILLEYHNHELRRVIDDLLKADYEMIGGEMTTMFGLGVAKYMRKDLMKRYHDALVRST